MTEKEKLEALFNLKSAFPADDEKRAFFRAAAENDRRVLQHTLEKWPAAAQKWRDGSGDAVISASSGMKAETLELLLKHGADIDDMGTPEARKFSALQKAALCGHLETVEMLLRHGAKVDLPDQYGQTPLIHAVKQEKLACADLLVLAGADTEYRSQLYRKSAFEECKSDEMRNVLKAALKKRAEFMADPTENPPPPKPEAFVPNPPPAPDPTTVKILKRIDLRFNVG